MLMFMEKPSKKLYPDYYKVIQEPIDMLTIESNIRAEKYTNEEQILQDFKVCHCVKYLSMVCKMSINRLCISFIISSCSEIAESITKRAR